MSTTTVRLSKELRERVASLAERSGVSTHSFILAAIAEKTDQAEREADFHETATARYASLLASGKTIPWEKMREYLEGRAAGRSPRKPKARKLER